MTTEQPDIDTAVCQHLQLLGHNGFGVTELRTFDNRSMVAYVDDDEKVVQLAREMEGKVAGIYVGVQPRSIDLFDYAPNCWRPAHNQPNPNCACNKDIEYITAVFFDIDVVSPQRRQGYPASEIELIKSREAAFLLSQQDGLAMCSTVCCSGNGHYVLTPLVPICTV